MTADRSRRRRRIVPRPCRRDRRHCAANAGSGRCARLVRQRDRALFAGLAVTHRKRSRAVIGVQNFQVWIAHGDQLRHRQPWVSGDCTRGVNADADHAHHAQKDQSEDDENRQQHRAHPLARRARRRHRDPPHRLGRKRLLLGRRRVSRRGRRWRRRLGHTDRSGCALRAKTPRLRSGRRWCRKPWLPPF